MSWKKEIAEIVAAFFIAWLFYQGLAYATGTSMPVVSVVSESMYHDTTFESWWAAQADYYESVGINREEFESFYSANGLAMGDLLLVVREDHPQIGDIILYEKDKGFTIIHRLVDAEDGKYILKGDRNHAQDPPVSPDKLQGKAVFAIPLLGYPRLALNLIGI